ncbi:hypothetical protein, partial [Lactobacillus delbrueckii]|uniref:hypothetical protein n=1 Tax=Lactobacillus delbrueckii TaxID=1584 RepID=UPI0021A76596
TLTPNLTAFTGVDSQNLPDVMVSVQFILAIGGQNKNDYWIFPVVIFGLHLFIIKHVITGHWQVLTR